MGMNLFLFFVVYGMKDRILLDGAIASDLNDDQTIDAMNDLEDERGGLPGDGNQQGDLGVAYARKLSFASVNSDASKTSLQYVRTISIT